MKTSEFKTSFADNDFNEWQKKLIKEIKIEDYNQAIKQDRNGIDIHPIFTESNHQQKSTHRLNDEWWIVSNFVVNNNEATVNAQILHQLNEGVTGIKILVQSSSADPQVLLAGIDLSAIQLIWSINDVSAQTAETIKAYLLSHQYNFNSGLFQLESAQAYDFIESTLHVNALVYNNAGATSITELSAALSQINQGLHDLENKGLLHQLKSISVSVAVDTQYFEQIAKLRAYRQLIQHIFAAYKIEANIYIHAETSHIYLTQKDVNNNLIRNTISAMSAVVGGCDSLTITAHNHYLSSSYDDNRLAKNQQLLLKEEAQFNDFLNAADGSYFLDYYTENICDKAYARFQKIEEHGGWSENQSNISQQIINDKTALLETYNNKSQTLIGINKYPNNMEKVGVIQPHSITWQGIDYLNLEQEINP